MSTKIRQIRKTRGLTLQALADEVGTTPQTIQRLETNTMTVSVEWLARIGKALGLPPAALLADVTASAVRYLGDLNGDGTVQPVAATAQPLPLHITVPGDDPMAVTLLGRLGPYDAGTILIAARLAALDHAQADGRDCLVQLLTGQLLFRRIVHGHGGPTAFVPYDDRLGVERNLDIDWIAPVVMVVRYLPAHQA
jgi:transcriptional regulator with XRE-family HTH domain